MSKNNLMFLFLLASLSVHGSALYRACQPISSAVRNACTRGVNTISRLRSYLQPYTPRWAMFNKNVSKYPWTNRIANISRVSWAKPAVMTGGLAAGAGLGTYCLRRNPVFAQEDRSFVQPEVRAFLQEAQKITNDLSKELQDCTDYACANGIFNKCENLIGVLLHNDYEGVSLQGSHQVSVRYLLQEVLKVKKNAVAKALDFAQSKIWSMWHAADGNIMYNEALINNMLSHIGHFSGASFKYDIFPQESDWVKIPLVYQRVLAVIARNPEIKQEVLNYMHKRASAINQQYAQQVANPLLDILYAIEKRLSI